MSIAYREVKVIEVRDFDDLVEKTYDKPYSFQQQDGCKERQLVNIKVPESHINDYGNDTLPEIVNHDDMGVSFKAWLERDPDKLLPDKNQSSTNLWWYRNFYPHISMIINDLHSKGLLEAGEYKINIDW